MITLYFFAVDRMRVTYIGVTFLPNSKTFSNLDSFQSRAYNSKALSVIDCLK